MLSRIRNRFRKDWYFLADVVGCKFKGSALKRRQKGVCILMGVIYAFWWFLAPDNLRPFVLISLLFEAVNMSYSIYLSMSSFPPKDKGKKNEGIGSV